MDKNIQLDNQPQMSAYSENQDLNTEHQQDPINDKNNAIAAAAAAVMTGSGTNNSESSNNHHHHHPHHHPHPHQQHNGHPVNTTNGAENPSVATAPPPPPPPPTHYIDSMNDNHRGDYGDPGLEREKMVHGDKDSRESATRAAAVAAAVNAAHGHGQIPPQDYHHHHQQQHHQQQQQQQPQHPQQQHSHNQQQHNPHHQHHPQDHPQDPHRQNQHHHPQAQHHHSHIAPPPPTVTAPTSSSSTSSSQHHQQQQQFAGLDMFQGHYVHGGQDDVVFQQMRMPPPPPPQVGNVPPPPGPPGPPVHEVPGGGRKRKSSAMSTDDNDMELRRRAQKYANEPLENLAKFVKDEENGPNMEKLRQVFGMALILQNCEESVESNVPRSRIYARYIEVCTNLNLKPLNPASFGKLVRINFPGIKTRRLGVRGQSKYHYCGIRIIGDTGTPSGGGTPSVNSPDIRDQLLNNIESASSSVVNSPYRHENSTSNNTPTHHSTANSVGSNSNNHNNSSSSINITKSNPRVMDDSFTNTAKEARKIQNVGLVNDVTDISLSSNVSLESFQVPQLSEFVDMNEVEDDDAVTTLYGLYLSHCRSLIEALRYMHIKKFLHIQGAFVGGLTAPVQKLFKQRGVQRWINQADWAAYRVMVQLLSPLVLQEVPPEVLKGLRTLCQLLPTHLQTSIKSLDESFIKVKMQPVTAFANLLDRLLRANEFGQNAGFILASQDETHKMKMDWNVLVDSDSIMRRQLPCNACNHRVKQILDTEVRQLLSPDEFGDSYDAKEGKFVRSKDKDEVIKGEDHIVKWAGYLKALPSRFPEIPPRLFLWAMSAILSTTLRDMSVSGGESFGAWWIVICWIEELMGWTSEMNGFMSIDSLYEEAVDQDSSAKSNNADDGVVIRPNGVLSGSSTDNQELFNFFKNIDKPGKLEFGGFSGANSADMSPSSPSPHHHQPAASNCGGSTTASVAAAAAAVAAASGGRDDEQIMRYMTDS